MRREGIKQSNMLFHSPSLGESELRVLSEIEELHAALSANLREPRRWVGSLRRDSIARAIQGSNSIEGYEAQIDDVAAVDLGEPPLDANTQTALALKGYRDAMTFVMRLADDESFDYNEQLLKSLHFMMTNHDLSARPGQWRLGSIFVQNDETDTIVYEGAPVSDVPKLMAELVRVLNETNDPPLVKAALAHLNLVMIHPFRDGNGRMARCLQSLVIARSGIRNPEFSSIEEYLGRNTPAYYEILAKVGRGFWQPDGDTQAWVRFILTAHLRQAKTMARRFREAEMLWMELEKLVRTHHLPERTYVVLYDAAIGYRVRNATYRASVASMEEITEATASRDLKTLLDLGLLQPHGEKRGRFYRASKKLSGLRSAITATRNPRDVSDPFADLSPNGIQTLF